MERQIYFSEQPKVMDWGEKKIVPLNVKTEVESDGQGGERTAYRADLVKKVKTPLTVDSIVDAAIDGEFDAAAQKRIMRNVGDETNEEVKRYKSFVAEVTAAAKEAGY